VTTLRLYLTFLCALIVAWVALSATLVATHRTPPAPAETPDVPVCEIIPAWQDHYLTTFVNCSEVSIRRDA
jgi:hypothetical protein